MVDTAATHKSAHQRKQNYQGVKLVCFRLHGQAYGIDIASVKETIALRPITRVFLTPPWLAGIINLRGDIVAVLDLANFCDLSPTDITEQSRIIIMQHQQHVAGIVVDELAELRVLDTALLEPPPATIGGEAASILAGVLTLEGESDAALRVIDIPSVFESERLRAFQRGES